MAKLPEVAPEVLQKTQELLKSLFAWVRAEHTKADIDGHTLARLCVVTMTQIAAILAVDTKMDKSVFLKICEDHYRQAYKKAPKFG